MEHGTLVTLRVAAIRLGVSSRWLRQEAEAGRLPHLPADKTLLFNFDEIEKLLLERASSAQIERSGADA